MNATRISKGSLIKASIALLASFHLLWNLKQNLSDLSGLQQAPAIGRAIMEYILDNGFQVPML